MNKSDLSLFSLIKADAVMIKRQKECVWKKKYANVFFWDLS